MKQVSVSELMKHCNLKNLTPEINTDEVYITTAQINRPAFPLAGYFKHFEATRIQILGIVEAEYCSNLSEEEKETNLRKFYSYKFPAAIYARGLEPSPESLKYAKEFGVPILSSDATTTDLMAEVIRWLKVKLAPSITIHGVLLDVFGEGVLITGDSGIGKSEAALELIKRGHRLVSDDVVEISKVSDATLIGSAPDITKHFIELRGIGIIDVKALYGVECVKDTQTIDMVIQLEDWDESKEYDRVGLEDKYTEYLGNKVVIHELPIRPGRNLAIICETAAVNHRQKKMGYNAAQALYERIQLNIRGEYPHKE